MTGTFPWTAFLDKSDFPRLGIIKSPMCLFPAQTSGNR